MEIIKTYTLIRVQRPCVQLDDPEFSYTNWMNGEDFDFGISEDVNFSVDCTE